MSYWKIRKPNQKPFYRLDPGITLGAILARSPPDTEVVYNSKEAVRAEARSFLWKKPDFNPDEWE